MTPDSQDSGARAWQRLGKHVPVSERNPLYILYECYNSEVTLCMVSIYLDAV
jgi:hypothetical protein